MNQIRTGHDAFAREEITKREVSGECSWCGNQNPRGKVWEYRIERDAHPGRFDTIRGQFCSIRCLNAYHPN